MAVSASEPTPRTRSGRSRRAEAARARSRTAPDLRGRPPAHRALPHRAGHLRVGPVAVVPPQGGRARSTSRARGPVILAPVHRSFADFGFAAFCTQRKLFFMTKDEMWKNKWLGKLLLTVGAFPVHRESADREALQRAEEVLRQGEVLVLFPEGTPARRPRHRGPDGGGHLPLRPHRGADRPHRHRRVRPGHAQGQHHPQAVHRSTWSIGPAMPAPPRTGGGRVSRSAVHAATEELERQLQTVYDQARQRTGRY